MSFQPETRLSSEHSETTAVMNRKPSGGPETTELRSYTRKQKKTGASESTHWCFQKLKTGASEPNRRLSHLYSPKTPILDGEQM